MRKHLVSRVARARQQIPRPDGPVFRSSQDRRDLSFGGGGPARPFTCRAKDKLGGETRLPMFRKIIQWVPIDGTRWRNEFVNSHENRGVGVHYGVAHRGVMAPFRELPNTAGLGGLLGLRLGVRALFSNKHEMETHCDVDTGEPSLRLSLPCLVQSF
jgi:hypothetical protein